MTEEERVIEAEKLFETIYKMRAFPAGRTLWVGGTEHSKTHGQSQFNCSFANINSLDDLHDIVILLMNGVGVGVGVRTEEVEKFAAQGELNLDKQVVIKDYEYVGEPGTGGSYDINDGAAYYTVHDSREGWAEFVRDFLGELLFSPDVHTIYVNLDHIRPEGTPLKTFGGRASGPKAIIDFIDGMIQISHGMTKINDIFLLDTANMLGRMVVAGGTRRSALIALGNADSLGFENAKTGDWGEKYPWREQANNSKVFYSKPTRESIKEGFRKILQYGEPAFVNGIMAKSIRRDWAGLNPCFTGDMRLLTEDGYITFRDAYEHGKPLKIIQDSRVTYEGDGEEKPEHWKIDPENTDQPVTTQASHVFLTKENADIVKLEFLCGTVLRCTPDHLIATTVGMVEAGKLTKYHEVLTYRTALCGRIAGEQPQTVDQHRAFALGALSVSARYSAPYDYIQLGKLKDSVRASIEAGYGERLRLDIKGKDISIDEVKRVTGYEPSDISESTIPDWISNNTDDKVGSWFVRGLLSTGLMEYGDGSYIMDVETSNGAMLDSVRSILRERGIECSYRQTGEYKSYRPRSHGDLGYFPSVYTFSIKRDADIYMSTIGLTNRPVYKKPVLTPSFTKLWSITPDGKEDVYCIKENTRRTLIVEGIVARRCAEILLSDKGFCNLVTTNMKYFAEHGNDEEMLKDTVEIITRHNLRITNTTIHGVSPQWDIVQKRDRLLGVSFTGYGDHADILGEDVSLETLGKMRKWVRDQANNYADKMGIPHPLLATTVKPEGTITLLYGASSGIHDAYAPYYIRRMRMSRTDALAVVLAKMGVPVEDAIKSPQTVVFSFPVKTAAKQAASQKSAVQQLERYKNIMKTYVDHNASNTIYIDESEVDEVTDWLYDNWDSYVAVSFLAKFGQYEQAPMEEIDEETYNKLAAQMPDLSDLHARLAEVEYEMSAGDELEVCDTGSCPIR
jgi:ribonucleotide reductase alpha subunit